MKLISKNNWIYKFLILWAVCFSIFHFKYSYKELLFNDNKHQFRAESDELANGVSKSGIIPAGDTMGLWFELRDYPDSISWPWAHVKMEFDNFVDASEYDFIEFEIKGSKTNKLDFTIGVNYPDGSNIPFHSLSMRALVDEKYDHVKLPLKEFKSREWWLVQKKLKPIPYEEVNYKEFSTFVVGAGERSVRYEREKIFLHSLKFTKYVRWPYFVFSGLIVVLIFVYLMVFLIKKLKSTKERNVVINYSSIPEEHIPGTTSSIDFIYENYSKVTISVSEISIAIGKSELKISSEIKVETGLTFKQFLNKVRIEKAEELLENKSLKIAVIAEMVGYENVTNFNRVFKKVNNMSPSEFRDSSVI